MSEQKHLLPFLREKSAFDRRRVLTGLRLALAHGAILTLPFLGCSTNAEDSGESSEAALEKSRRHSGNILGFEDATLWKAAGGTVSSSDRRMQGEQSLRISGSGSAELTSKPFRLSEGKYGGVGIYIAAAATSAGDQPVDVTLSLEANSCGLNVVLGPQRLAGLADGFFQRLEFAFSADSSARLADLEKDIRDLRIKVALAPTQAAFDFLVDDISFLAAPPPPPVSGDSVENHVVTIRYPQSMGLLDIALLTSDRLELSKRSSVVTPQGGFAPVVNVGTSRLEVGQEARVGDVVSVSRVTLERKSTVTGNVTSASSVNRESGSVVTGSVNANAAVPLRELSWTVPFEVGKTDITVYPHRQRSAEPGAYDRLLVRPHGKLSLQAGTYYADSLEVYPEAKLALDTTRGPVVLYVRKSLRILGNSKLTGGGGDFLLVYLGNREVDIDGPFSGTVVAPHAGVDFKSGCSELSGAAFARSIELDPHTTFKFRPAFTVIGRGSPSACARLLADSNWRQTSTPISYQEALFRYCGKSDVGSCETALIARINADFFSAAQRVIQGTMTPSAHLAVVFDRERKKRLFHGNEALACEILNGDADGDFVATSRDRCPTTPELTATFDDGCTDPNLPPAPPLPDGGIGSIVFSGDPRCQNAISPTTPTPFGAWRFPSDPNVGKALWISKDSDPSGCPTWYQLEGQLTDGTTRSIAFTVADSQDLAWIHPPANTLQFNIRVGDGGGRGAWASYGVYTRQYRARAINAAGLRSPWSSWYQPGQETCAAGACAD